MSNSSNQHDQKLPLPVDAHPDTPAAGGLRGEGTVLGTTPQGNTRTTELNGRTIAVEEDSGNAAADTHPAANTSVSNVDDA